jgi:hypothetical protein
MPATRAGSSALPQRPGVIDDGTGDTGRCEWQPEQIGVEPPPGCAPQPPRLEPPIDRRRDRP